MAILKRNFNRIFYRRREDNKCYFVSLEQSEDEAQNFINMFIQYSTERLIYETRNPLDGMKAPMKIMNESQIIPVDFDIDTVECGVVYARELMDKI